MANITNYVHGPLIVKKNGQNTALSVQNSTSDVLLETVTPNLPSGVTNMDDLIQKFGALAFKSKVEMIDVNELLATSSNINSVTSSGKKITDAFLTKDIKTKVDTLNQKNFICYDNSSVGLAPITSEINDNVTSTSSTWSSYKISDKLTAVETAVENIVNNTIEKEIKPLITAARTGAVSDITDMIEPGFGAPVGGKIADSHATYSIYHNYTVNSIGANFRGGNLNLTASRGDGKGFLDLSIPIASLYQVWTGAKRVLVNNIPSPAISFTPTIGISTDSYRQTFLVNGHFEEPESQFSTTFSVLVTLQGISDGGPHPGYYGGQYAINSSRPYSTVTAERMFRVGIWKANNTGRYDIFFVTDGATFTLVVTEVIKLYTAMKGA